MSELTIEYFINNSVEYLESIADNPHTWITSSRNKWCGAWWHMAALYEIGAVKRIPENAIKQARNILINHVWPVFILSKLDEPVRTEDLDKWDCCHCELGVFYSILASYGCDIDRDAPWIRQWFITHQLPDGGLNCDPDAYSGSQKSSIVSTLPPLEAILYHTQGDYSPTEKQFLDRGAHYLLTHQLVKSSQGQLINTDWLKPCFPRFFEYDILRGLTFLITWSERRKKSLPDDFLQTVMTELTHCRIQDNIIIGRTIYDCNGEWPGPSFPLLEKISEVGTISPNLTLNYQYILSRMN